MEACLVFLCDANRMRILYGLQICMLGLGVAFFSVAIHASGECFSTPCNDSRGLQTMWKVDNGLAFLAMSTGICYMLHSLVGLVVLFKKCDLLSAGAFLGLGAALCLASLTNSVVWGTRATMIADMGGPYSLDSTSYRVNNDAQPLFAWLSSISGIVFGMQIISLAMMGYAMDSITSDVEPRAPRQYSPVAKADPASFKSYQTTSGGLTETERLMHSDYKLEDTADDNPFHDNPDGASGQDHLTI